MSYGTGICRQTLVLLSSDEDFEERIFRAFREFEVITNEDVSADDYKELIELSEK